MTDDEMAPVHELTAVLESLPGVIFCDIVPAPIGHVEPAHLSLGAEVADLPQVAIMRTNGGRDDEVVYRTTLMFDRAPESFLTIEFLAWWVRDWARSGHCIQMRVRGLPPKLEHVQLGSNLQFFIEYFMISDDPTEVLPIFGEMAESIRENMNDYADCFENPRPADRHLNPPPEYTFEELQQLGEEDADAAYTVARAYETGEGVDADADQAFRWYTRAAELGSVTANFLIGRQYLSGEGVEQNFRKAFDYLKFAADEGMDYAIASIGEMYMEGQGVEKNPEEGLRWYQKAAEGENPVCFAELGECYEEGKGTEVDLEKALELYDSAYNGGFEPVKEALDRVRKALGLDPLP